jgi:FlaA1/EpsC-like NDP-sugar epimerase
VNSGPFSVPRKRLALIAFGFAIAAAIVGAYISHSSLLYYPFVVIQAPQDLTLTFIHYGRTSLTECESVTAATTNLLHAGCLSCRTRSHECTSTLSEEQHKILFASVLDVPSVFLPDGVATYSSPNVEFAKAACLESENQSRNSPSRLKCFLAGSQRALPETASKAAPAEFRQSSVWAAIAVLALLSGGYVLVHGRTSIVMSGLVAWPRRRKQFLILAVDIVSIEITLWLAFILRLEYVYIPSGDTTYFFALAPIVAIPIFLGFGLYRSVIRYLGMRAIGSIAKAMAVYISLLTFAVYMAALDGIPRSVLAIHGVLALLTIGATRAVASKWLKQLESLAQGSLFRKNVVVYGAGSAGIQLAMALVHSKELKPVAFLDDDVRLHRTRMGELEVFPPQRLRELVDRFQVKEVLLAIPSTSRFRRNEIISLLERLQVQVRTLPGLSHLAEGKIKTDDLREVDIEDLLGRDPVAPDTRLLRAIVTGKSVMVTGAGGSIGSELARQILALKPETLVLYEQSEFALYSIEMDLNARAQSLPAPVRCRIMPLLGSVSDQGRLERTISALRVQTIFHAAAYKHVPIVERNPCEGIFNNIIGTKCAAQAALNLGVSTFVLISTDKAVRPTNTMGASKRFAEMILQAYAQPLSSKSAHTSFSIVRFGNVLGSSGSVVPLFREQIRRGGPVTVTDPRMLRYFMTISEATQLVIQAGAMGTRGDVFVLDMGAPVSILDLAQRMIRLSGLHVRNADQPRGDIEIVFSGLRPGEKLYEELLIGDNVISTEHPRILRANEKMLPLDVIQQYLADLEKVLSVGDSDIARTLLLEAVEEFKPQCENEDALKLPQAIH